MVIAAGRQKSQKKYEKSHTNTKGRTLYCALPFFNCPAVGPILKTAADRSLYARITPKPTASHPFSETSFQWPCCGAVVMMQGKEMTGIWQTASQ
jgi:hypothetical protein